ncbi:bifunctional adenosylcobinamide kinase/adenosylcobinamide-phosphate guanylyltransferase [Halomonas sp. ML-15]|uniref:bifunctional adenosylcobinamide kinase/adenosylcobinamide-phosphate guanylyltransferase n=1 Tax=Halomonas sp. ML-15 TaxID=2773305 RepID=UPI001745C6FC|nr:bifunctional adenosylcobinamide kinase/adenosylcobinamide-phosphate guanylyltransferase [Halomonas sp. ML-15]MBD3897604.1 bifunctional adenosylcobinamide kinase/adenosylcobinamide-phosphate guanylyltransferase [Halomonas sp. ML-15]
MQLVIGGACAGKRGLVQRWYPHARWHALEGAARHAILPASGETLVVSGWAGWIQAALASTPSDDEALRLALTERLDALLATEAERAAQVVLIVEEMGRGIVPMGAERRRLRDLNGWLAQDASARCERVWYVRHGLYRRLDTPDAQVGSCAARD